MGDRTQRAKGKANEIAGKAKGDVGYETGSTKTEAKGAAQTLKGKTQQTGGEARSKAKKETRQKEMTAVAPETVGERLAGHRPSRLRALIVSGAAALGAGVLTYKLL